MHNSPSVAELLQGVTTFLNTVASLQLTEDQLSEHAQFHARVSANALALVARDVAARPINEDQAIALYRDLLQSDETDLATLERAVCAHIRTGAFHLETQNLMVVLRTCAQAQLRVDQPKYSGLGV